MKASEFLDRNDAYNFFMPLGDLVVTGPTFSNVNGFRALLVIWRAFTERPRGVEPRHARTGWRGRHRI